MRDIRAQNYFFLISCLQLRSRPASVMQSDATSVRSTKETKMATRINTDTGVVESNDNFFGFWLPKDD